MAEYKNSYKEKYLRLKRAAPKIERKESLVLTELTNLRVEYEKLKEILTDVMLSASTLETAVEQTRKVGNMEMSSVSILGNTSMMLDDVGNLSTLIRVATDRMKTLHAGLEFELDKGPIEEQHEVELMNSVLFLKATASEYSNAKIADEEDIDKVMIDIRDKDTGNIIDRRIVSEERVEDLDRSILNHDQDSERRIEEFRRKRLRRYHPSRVMNSSMTIEGNNIRASLPTVDQINFTVLRAQLNNTEQLMIRGLDNNALLSLAAEEDLDYGIGWKGSKLQLGRKIRSLIRRS